MTRAMTMESQTERSRLIMNLRNSLPPIPRFWIVVSDHDEYLRTVQCRGACV